MTSLVNGDRKVPWAADLSIEAPLTPLKYEVAINARALPETTEPDRLLHYIDIGSVDSLGRTSSVEEFTFGGAPSRARRLPRAGDTIVSTVRTYLRAIAFIERDDPALVCSTGFAVVTAGKRLDPRYLAHWMRSDPVVDEICARSTGVSYPAINASEIGCLPVPLLPLDRQRRVADFLDRKTAAIDALIAKKERLIELLQEKRQALITQAVTKGLDPNVPMKESGFPWLGRVPAHWSVNKLRRISKRVDVGIAEAATHAYAETGVPIIRSTNVANNRFDPEQLLYIAPWFAEKNRSKYLWAGDLVTVRTGNAGVTTVVPPRLDRSQCFTLLMTTLRTEHMPAFFSYLLNCEAGRTYFALESWGTAQQNISVPILGDMKVAVPPQDEQASIVKWVRAQVEQVDRILTTVETHTDRLREYRQALVTAAVTGKIDVSPEAA